MIAAVCRKAGAAEVVISDLSTSRLAMAEKLGATHIVNAGKEDSEAGSREMEWGKGI